MYQIIIIVNLFVNILRVFTICYSFQPAGSIGEDEKIPYLGSIRYIIGERFPNDISRKSGSKTAHKKKDLNLLG
jgi:hypothetical protein